MNKMDNMMGLFENGGLLNYHGRIGRKQYIIYCLCAFVSLFILNIIMLSLGDNSPLFAYIFLAALFIPILIFTFVISVKRLHDLDKSAWWYVPIFVLNILGNYSMFFSGMNLLIALFLFCKRGTIGDNQYGPDPVANKE